ncbi:hypothetical protein CMO89_00485 [Candidatus Woesearchaeota archaeon]|nr:hypothetical protein [Candidatus Woesearchaeota archaeon]
MDFMKVAIKAAKAAGEIIKKRDLGKIKEKTIPGDLVTKADIEANDIIIKIIKENFPEHNIISEEIHFDNIPSGYTWVIDPIDGTLPYTLGFDYSAVSITLMKDHVPIVTVIFHPMLNELFTAEKDKGAFMNGKRIKVSNENRLSHSTGYCYFLKTNRSKGIKTILLKLADKVKFFFETGCGCWDFTRIAQGRTDWFTHEYHSIWDLVPGVLLITEAGGKATDLEGKPLDLSKKKNACILSNGKVHDQIIKAIKKGDE